MLSTPLVRVPYRPGLGALAGNTSTIGSGAASGAAAGAVAGPIGAVIGGAIGAIAGIFGGQSNPQIQIDKTNAINLFSQYQGIAGTVSGRSIGLENMNMILRGACFMGHFPSWGNSTELPDSLMSMPGSPYGQNDNCFAVLWSAAAKGVAAPGGSGVNTGNNGVPVKDAKTFVDNYVWPSNSPDVDSNPWVTNTDSVGKQVIYDAADAYIATQTSSSVPYIASAPTPAPTPATTPVSTSATAPTRAGPVPTTSPTASSGSTLTVNQAGSLVTPQGTWSQSGNSAFYLNGNQATNFPTQADWTVALLYQGGQVYAYNMSGTDYVWNGTWYQTASAPAPPAALQQVLQQYVKTTPATPAAGVPQAPPQPTVIESTDGSTVTATGTALETAGGTLIYFGPQAAGDPDNSSGYPIWESGVHQGYGVGLLMANGGTVYAVNAGGLWYQWSENGWQQLAGAPTVSSATPTTSTVSSAQASSTPVVAASAAACQLVSTPPVTTAAAAPASSDLGLYLVLGGLGILGLMYFMSRRT